MFQKNNIRSVVLVCMTLLWSGITFSAPIMYVHDDGARLGTVNVESGAVNLIGTLGPGTPGARNILTDIAFSPTGDLYGVNNAAFFSVDAETALASLVGSSHFLFLNALVFGPDGTLYAASSISTALYTIDAVTGVVTDLGDMNYESGGDLAFHDGNLYLASNTSELVLVDLEDLSNTSAVGFFGVEDVFGLATGDDNVLYAVAGTTIYTVDVLTGAVMNPVSFADQGLTAAFGQAFYTESGAVVVPLPATAWLMMTGVGFLGLRARWLARRRVPEL